MVAAEAHRFEELIEMINEEWIIDWHREVDMAHMTWAIVAVKATSHAPMRIEVLLGNKLTVIEGRMARHPGACRRSHR